MLKRERNRGRIEIRSLEAQPSSPTESYFPGVRTVARLRTQVRQKDTRTGKMTRSKETVYLVSSLEPEQLEARGMLTFKRNYWVVESRLHHCLDVTLREDTSRVRTPNSARVLGTIRRVIVSLANAAVNKARLIKPKSKANTGDFQARYNESNGGAQRLYSLIFSNFPALPAL